MTCTTTKPGYGRHVRRDRACPPQPRHRGSALAAQPSGQTRRAARGGVCLARRQGLSVVVSGGSLDRQSHMHAPPYLRRRGALLTVSCEDGCKSSTPGGQRDAPSARAGAARPHGAAGCAPRPPCRLLGHFVDLSSTQSSKRLWYKAAVSRMCFSRAPSSDAKEVSGRACSSSCTTATAGHGTRQVRLVGHPRGR